MNVSRVRAADVLANLTDSFKEWQALDVAHRAADLRDDDIHVVVRAESPNTSLDLVRDMGNDLHGVTQIVAAAFLLDDGLVHRAGGHVGVAPEVLTGESFVVAEIEVGFSAIVGNEDLTMLERVHRPGVDVDVRVQLLVDDFQSPSFEESAER